MILSHRHRNINILLLYHLGILGPRMKDKERARNSFSIHSYKQEKQVCKNGVLTSLVVVLACFKLFSMALMNRVFFGVKLGGDSPGSIGVSGGSTPISSASLIHSSLSSWFFSFNLTSNTLRRALGLTTIFLVGSTISGNKFKGE